MIGGNREVANFGMQPTLFDRGSAVTVSDGRGPVSVMCPRDALLLLRAVSGWNRERSERQATRSSEDQEATNRHDPTECDAAAPEVTCRPSAAG